MQQALLQTVNVVLTGGVITREMKETFVALFPEEEGKEHILENCARYA